MENNKSAYDNCILRYKISEEPYFKEMNSENYEKMKEALKAVGIWFNVEDGELRLSIFAERYDRVLNRNAGRKKAHARNVDKGDYTSYRYADIVYMMQTMQDQEIADKINMSIATYYRHKKMLKASDYYKSLDRNKLDDLAYLSSVPENYVF